jgi:hypothetical protein
MLIDDSFWYSLTRRIDAYLILWVLLFIWGGKSILRNFAFNSFHDEKTVKNLIFKSCLSVEIMGVALRMRYGLIRLVELYQKESSFAFWRRRPLRGGFHVIKLFARDWWEDSRQKLKRRQKLLFFSLIYKYQNLTQILKFWEKKIHSNRFFILKVITKLKISQSTR